MSDKKASSYWACFEEDYKEPQHDGKMGLMLIESDQFEEVIIDEEYNCTFQTGDESWAAEVFVDQQIETNNEHTDCVDEVNVIIKNEAGKMTLFKVEIHDKYVLAEKQ